MVYIAADKDKQFIMNILWKIDSVTVRRWQCTGIMKSSLNESNRIRRLTPSKDITEGNAVTSLLELGWSQIQGKKKLSANRLSLQTSRGDPSEHVGEERIVELINLEATIGGNGNLSITKFSALPKLLEALLSARLSPFIMSLLSPCQQVSVKGRPTSINLLELTCDISKAFA
uniref:Uncharacterized protein n=1 Tax=Glossina austeni TaxID=7395 RepID=A0A1A9VFK4_GLOAU